MDILPCVLLFLFVGLIDITAKCRGGRKQNNKQIPGKKKNESKGVFFLNKKNIDTLLQ